MGRLKTREWKTWHKVAGVENMGVTVSYSIRKCKQLHQFE